MLLKKYASDPVVATAAKGQGLCEGLVISTQQQVAQHMASGGSQSSDEQHHSRPHQLSSCAMALL